MVNKRILAVIVILVVGIVLAVALMAYFLTMDNNTYVYADIETMSIGNVSLQIRGRVLKSPQGDDVHTYLGIPYAEPPVGQLRFADPQPKKISGDMLKANEYSDACLQELDEYFGDFYGATMWNPVEKLSEYCLSLNIWVPTPRKENRHVIVWIHGGAFDTGSGSLWLYDGRTLAAHGDVIVVTINYRLNLLGFLSTEDGSISGNFGLKDQQMALRWVHDNIASFGGNPSEVTIIGESAGAGSVGYHMILPSSKGLFKRVIVASGAPTGVWARHTAEEQKKSFDNLVKRVGCDKSIIGDAVKCLREVDADELFENMSFRPIIDGIFIPEHPKILVEKHEFNVEDGVLLGCNKDEGSFFLVYALPGMVGPDGPTTDYLQTRDMYNEGVETIFKDRFPPAVVTRVREFYKKTWNKDSLMDAIGDLMMVCPTSYFAEELASAAKEGKIGGNVYFYDLTYRASNEPWPEWMGVMHGSDIQWYFGHPLDETLGYTEDEVLFSKQVMDYFLSFAKTGRVTRKDARFDVPSYGYNQGILNLGGNGEISIKQGPLHQSHCEFWKELEEKLASDGRKTLL